VTGGRAPVALELARLFAAGGDTVFVADSAPHFLARSSKWIAGAFEVPSPRQSPRAFANAIAASVTRERINAIVPTCEEVFYLARFAGQLGNLTDLFCPSLDVLRSLHDKWSFSRLAGALGVEVPATWLLQSAADLARLPLSAEELVFKPVYSRFAVHTLVRPAQAAVQRLRPTSDQPWVAQRFVAGRELCTYAVARAGRLTAHAVYAPTWRAGKSSSFYFSPVDCPAIEQFTSRLVGKLGLTGQIGFDFIAAPDGTVHVLECNPRATSGVHLFDAADGLGAAFGIEPLPTGVIRPGTRRPRKVASAMLLIGLPQAWRYGRLRQWLADYRRARDVVWSADDPGPAAYQFVGLVDYLGLAYRQRISPLAASTHDLQWDGQPIE
jgi:predicted ATP-grasp superfamily ATP-dependent carboligase